MNLRLLTSFANPCLGKSYGVGLQRHVLSAMRLCSVNAPMPEGVPCKDFMDTRRRFLRPSAANMRWLEIHQSCSSRWKLTRSPLRLSKREAIDSGLPGPSLLQVLHRTVPHHERISASWDTEVHLLRYVVRHRFLERRQAPRPYTVLLAKPRA